MARCLCCLPARSYAPDRVQTVPLRRAPRNYFKKTCFPIVTSCLTFRGRWFDDATCSSSHPRVRRTSFTSLSCFQVGTFQVLGICSRCLVVHASVRPGRWHLLISTAPASALCTRTLARCGETARSRVQALCTWVSVWQPRPCAHLPPETSWWQCFHQRPVRGNASSAKAQPGRPIDQDILLALCFEACHIPWLNDHRQRVRSRSMYLRDSAQKGDCIPIPGHCF